METTDELFEPSERPKLNSISEQEENIASEEIIDTDAMGQRTKETTEMAASEETQQPSTSNTQMIDRQ